MHHNLSLITTFAAALGFGLLFGMLALRLRLPALVGRQHDEVRVEQSKQGERDAASLRLVRRSSSGPARL